MRARGLEAALTVFSPARRGFCPSREDLVSYFDAVLTAEGMAATRAHLAVCPFCTADLEDLTALATPPLLEAVVQIVRGGLKLLSHSFEAHAALTPATARGAASAAVELTTAAEDGELHLRLHRNPAASPDLRVQLAAVTSQGRVRVSLYRSDALLESHLSDGDEVLFAAVEPGDYRLTLAPVDGDEVARVALRIEDETAGS
ncbi:MAG: hypothetical protein HZB16_06725 [Armatimonadetes bacterium]|nr:hypothetical protein [Armatimonadota bacterium]